MSSKLKFLAGLSVVVAAVTACTEPKAKSKLAQDLPAGNKIEFFDDAAKEFMTGVTEYNKRRRMIAPLVVSDLVRSRLQRIHARSKRLLVQ